MIMYKLYPAAIDNEYSSLTAGANRDIEKFNEMQELVIQGGDENNSSGSDVLDLAPVDTRPPFDPSLTKTPTLIIDSIGVHAEIQEGTDPEKALQKGPWRVPEFATPDEEGLPVIIASHRWGGIGWNEQQRTRKSFYNLPKTKVGDRIEIIWDQRKYEYEIYKAEEGEEITDYDADLILYTCKLYWESPIRIFRYATRVEDRPL